MTRPQRILLIRLSHLGDVVHALPVYHALRSSRPDARIAWAVQPEFAELVAALPGLDRTIPFDRRGGAGAWLRFGESVAAFGPDLVVDAQGNSKSAVAGLCAVGAARVGLHRRDWREGWGALALTSEAPPVGPDAHAVARMLALADFVAGDALGGARRRDPDLSEPERALGRSRLTERLDVAGGAPPVFVQVGDPTDVRSWPPEHYARLLAGLDRERLPTLVVSGPGEERAGAALAAGAAGALPFVRHWVGQRGLRELAAVLAAVAERGGAFVGSDSGPLHLAASVDLPVLLLAGPQAHDRTGPWPVAERPGAGERSPNRVVRAAVEPPCAPCFARRCGHPRGAVCMSGIDADRVLATLLSEFPTTAG